MSYLFQFMFGLQYFLFSFFFSYSRVLCFFLVYVILFFEDILISIVLQVVRKPKVFIGFLSYLRGTDP